MGVEVGRHVHIPPNIHIQHFETYGVTTMANYKKNELYYVDYLDSTFGMRKVTFNYEESASDFVNQLLSEGCTYLYFYKITSHTLLLHEAREEDV